MDCHVIVMYLSCNCHVRVRGICLPSWRQLPPLGHVVFFTKYAVHAKSTQIITLRVKPLYLFGVVWGAALHCWHSPPSPKLQGGTCPRTWPAACVGIQGPLTDKLTTVLWCCMQLLRVRVRVEARRGPQRKRSKKRTERCLKAKRATRRDTCFF